MKTRAETFSSIIYWLGSALLVQKMLIETTVWFEYWAAIIMLLGLSLVARQFSLRFGDKIFGIEGAPKRRSLTLKSLENDNVRVS
jgi:hypothetical protein